MGGPVWREVDLHGMDRVSARRLVMETLENCRRAGVKRLRIVHGKGTGVLRDEVRAILAEYDAVEDLRPAPPREGGDGAVEVRLDWSR